MVSSSHGSSLFLTTCRKHVMAMPNYPWRNGNLLYTIYPITLVRCFEIYVHPILSPGEEHTKKWLRPGSVTHNALHMAVLQDTLLRDIKKINRFPSYRLSGSLPFHNIMLSPDKTSTIYIMSEFSYKEIIL